ncbi:hypothetical protein Vadar_004094 [Vaccinium darrowii]|uniref:Uncharacterized protein n=1 Tax=Vaccinium darrowii TaxID=229202 RepID=A0ACB7XNI5_9ERIC|nr:hypothetical protein Vadar_004094 [Vaccinium darrowii]
MRSKPIEFRVDQLRHEEDAIPNYINPDSWFSVKVYHGGCFMIEGNVKSYVGGKISYNDYENRCQFLLMELDGIGQNLGFKDYVEYYFKVPSSQGGFKIIETHDQVMDMLNHIKDNVVDIYIAFLNSLADDLQEVDVANWEWETRTFPESGVTIEDVDMVEGYGGPLVGMEDDDFDVDEKYEEFNDSDYDLSDEDDRLFEENVDVNMQGSKQGSVGWAIRQHSIMQGKDIRFIKNETTRVRAKCKVYIDPVDGKRKKECPWELCASDRGKGNHSLQVKTYNPNHTCGRIWNNRLMCASWLANQQQSCSCRRWDLTGIPCEHAARVIVELGGEPEEYVSDWYSKHSYLTSYGNIMHPMNGPDMWEKSLKVWQRRPQQQNLQIHWVFYKPHSKVQYQHKRKRTRKVLKKRTRKGTRKETMNPLQVLTSYFWFLKGPLLTSVFLYVLGSWLYVFGIYALDMPLWTEICTRLASVSVATLTCDTTTCERRAE